MAKLYEIMADMERLCDTDEEFDDQALAVLSQELEKKTDSIGALLRTISTDVDTLKAEEKRLADRRKALENREREIKEYVLFQMKAHSLDKFKGELFTLSRQASPPSAVCDEEAATPAEFITIIPAQHVPDKKRIVEALKAGREVPGWHLERGEHLRVR